MSGSDGYGIDVGLAKADTCCKSTGNKILHHSKKLSKSITLRSWKKNSFIISTPENGLYKVSLYSLDGSLIEQKEILSKNNIAIYNNVDIAKGSYLLKVNHKVNKYKNTFIISN